MNSFIPLRKFYSILIALVSLMIATASTAQQVVNEDFESYNTGSYMATEVPTQWETWGAGPLGGLISEEQAHGGNKSMKVYKNGSTDTDVILNLNDRTTGRYRIEFYMYIPTGHTGYYNILQDFNEADSKWGIQLTFNDDTVKIDANGHQYTHLYSPDSWIKIQHFVNLDNDWVDFYMNDELVISYQWSKGTNGAGGENKLDAIDFYSHTVNNQSGLYYIDDILIEDVPAPAAPTNLTAIVQNENDVVLNWDPVDNENLVYYTISRDGEAIGTTTETTYTDTHVYPGLYYYRVYAYCGPTTGYSNPDGTSIHVEGYVERESVLIETFSRVNCGYCTYAAKALDNLEAAGNLDIIVLEHHISETYGYSQSANRFQYWSGKSNIFGERYGFGGTPSMVFDGYIGMAGLYSTTISEEQQYITTFYEYVKNINSIYNLTAELHQTILNSKNFVLDVTAEKLSEYFGNDQIAIVFALTEDINYNWGVAGKINNLVRVLGSKTATFDENNQYNTSFEITVNDDYDISKCKFVVWVENHTQGRVMQSKKFKISDYYENSIAEEKVVSSIYPNPSNGMFSISGENIESIDVYDITGKLVMQQQINANNAIIDLTQKAKGIYTLKSYNGNNVSVSKLIIE